LAEIRSFRSQTLQLFLSMLDGRSSWATLISVLRILIGNQNLHILSGWEVEELIVLGGKAIHSFNSCNSFIQFIETSPENQIFTSSISSLNTGTASVRWPKTVLKMLSSGRAKRFFLGR